MKMGWHYTPCEAASAGGGGGLVAVVLFVLVVGGAVVTALQWLAGLVASVGRAAVAAAPAFIAVAVALVVALLAGAVWAVVWSRRQPARSPVDPPRYRSPAELRQTTIRPVDGSDYPALDQATRDQLVAELTRAMPMPDRSR